MNRTKIEWTQFTWNPLVGCLGGCGYCYARGQAKRSKHHCEKCYEFKPHLHKERLEEPMRRKKPSLIFADSMSDPFGEGVFPDWRWAILNVMRKCPQHTFQLLTKRPDLIPRNDYPSNLWIGVSIEGTEWKRVTTLGRRDVPHRFLSLEPFIRGPPDLDHVYATLTEGKTEWVIVGGLSKGRYHYPPRHEWVNTIVAVCLVLRLPIFLKKNVDWKGKELMEYPKEMKVMLEAK